MRKSTTSSSSTKRTNFGTTPLAATTCSRSSAKRGPAIGFRTEVRSKESHSDLRYSAEQSARGHPKPCAPFSGRKGFDRHRQPPAFLRARIKEYDIAERESPERAEAHAEIIRIYELIREQVVTPLTVRRTRRDLMEDKRYKADLEEQGIIFPKVEKPTPIFISFCRSRRALRPHHSTSSRFPSRGGFTYNRYRAIAFLSNLKLREKYERADLVAQQLARHHEDVAREAPRFAVSSRS